MKCKACYGKKQHSVLEQERGSDDFGGEGYVAEPKIVFRDCSRCRGTGDEPSHLAAQQTPSPHKEEICESGCGIDGEVREDAACACSGDETRGVCPCHQTATASKECCGKPMVENGNGTGIRCAKKCGYWEAKPPFIKVEIVGGSGIQRGHRAVVFDDTRITPVKVSPCEVEESWAVDVNDLIKNPAIAALLDHAKAEERQRCHDAVKEICEKKKVQCYGDILQVLL